MSKISGLLHNSVALLIN